MRICFYWWWSRDFTWIVSPARWGAKYFYTSLIIIICGLRLTDGFLTARRLAIDKNCTRLQSLWFGMQLWNNCMREFVLSSLHMCGAMDCVPADNSLLDLLWIVYNKTFTLNLCPNPDSSAWNHCFPTMVPRYVLAYRAIDYLQPFCQRCKTGWKHQNDVPVDLVDFWLHCHWLHCHGRQNKNSSK